MAGTLIVDLGSTGLAWRGPAGSGGARHGGSPGRVLARALAGATPPALVVMGSVAADAVTADLRALCEGTWKAEVRALAAGAEALGVRNGYRIPERLGIDRWAAVVAAFRRHGGPVLVADCGTALTVDFVDAAGRHRGGAVAPGLGLMRSALEGATRLRLGPVAAPPARPLGTDTEEAVAAGVFGAAAGLLGDIRAAVTADHGAMQAALLTGGDAAAMRERLGADWTPAPALVLEGLALLAGETP